MKSLYIQGSGGLVPRFLKLGTRYRWGITYMRTKLEDLMCETTNAYSVLVWNLVLRNSWERQFYTWEYHRHINNDRGFFLDG
jgi:hypothetical protein